MMIMNVSVPLYAIAGLRKSEYWVEYKQCWYVSDVSKYRNGTCLK